MQWSVSGVECVEWVERGVDEWSGVECEWSVSASGHADGV